MWRWATNTHPLNFPCLVLKGINIFYLDNWNFHFKFPIFGKASDYRYTYSFLWWKNWRKLIFEIIIFLHSSVVRVLDVIPSTEICTMQVHICENALANSLALDLLIGVLRHMNQYFSLIYDGTDVKADWRRSCCTYVWAPNAIYIFAGFFNVPVLHRHWTNLFKRWFRHTAHLVAFYDTLGIRRTYSRLKPRGLALGDALVRCLSIRKSSIEACILRFLRVVRFQQSLEIRFLMFTPSGVLPFETENKSTTILLVQTTTGFIDYELYFSNKHRRAGSPTTNIAVDIELCGYNIRFVILPWMQSSEDLISGFYIAIWLRRLRPMSIAPHVIAMVASMHRTVSHHAVQTLISHEGKRRRKNITVIPRSWLDITISRCRVIHEDALASFKNFLGTTNIRCSTFFCNAPSFGSHSPPVLLSLLPIPLTAFLSICGITEYPFLLL